MIRKNAPFSGILISREINPKVRTLEDPEGSNMLHRE